MKKRIETRDILIYFAIKYNGDFNKMFNAIQSKEDLGLAKEELEVKLSKVNSKVLTILDVDYPSCLKHAYRPPLVLFYHGDLSLINNPKCLSVVGSNISKSYGEDVAMKVIEDMPKDVTILARTCEHISKRTLEKAIDVGLKTVCVLDAGVNYSSPNISGSLYKELKTNHLIISEYPDVTEPSHDSTIRSNEVLTGLSKVLVFAQVVEKTPSTIAMNLALSNQKEIYVAPTSIFDKTYNNRLICEGAAPFIGVQQIVEDLKW